MFQDLKDLVNRDIRELAWLMFRESAKTSFAKIFLTYLITYEIRKYLNADSFDSANSENILFDTVTTLQTNQRLLMTLDSYTTKVELLKKQVSRGSPTLLQTMEYVSRLIPHKNQ